MEKKMLEVNEVSLGFDEVITKGSNVDLSKFTSIKVSIEPNEVLKVLMVLKDKSEFLLSQQYKKGFMGTINYTYVSLVNGKKTSALKVVTGLDNTDGLITKVTSGDLNSIRKLVKEQTSFKVGKYDLKF